MDYQPTLTGERVIIRPVHEADFEPMFRAASDPLIWEQHPEPDRYQRDVFTRFFRGAVDGGKGFAIVDRVTGEIIGSSRYREVDGHPEAIEIGWTFLARAYWGGPTNAEVKALMIDHAFSGHEKIIFTIGVNNRRSRRAVEKLGANLEATWFPPEIAATPEFADKVVYSLTRA